MASYDRPRRRRAPTPSEEEALSASLRTPDIVALLALQRAAGNQAVARSLAPKRLLQRDPFDITRNGATERVYASPQDEAKIIPLFEFIEQYGAVNSVRAAQATKERWTKWGGGARTAASELEKIGPEGWMLTELEGLKAALEVAGDVPNLRNDPESNEVSWIEDERGWMFGKVTGTIGGGKFEAPGNGPGGGETIRKYGESPWGINLTGSCDLSVFEMEPEDQPGDDPAVKRGRSVRRATGVFVHEFAHTAYARFSSDWTAFRNGPGKGEPPPTKYANKNEEEDFCETFMLYKLYRDQLRTRAPLRDDWMASNPLLGNAVPPVPQAIAANA
jgi:hypothetical protein